MLVFSPMGDFTRSGKTAGVFKLPSDGADLKPEFKGEIPVGNAASSGTFYTVIATLSVVQVASP